NAAPPGADANAAPPGADANAAPPGADAHTQSSNSIDAGGHRQDLSPPPASVPPWPYSTWPMGGTPAIGYENIYYGPLMDAIWCGRNGRELKDSRVTVYGWIEPGANISTSSSSFSKSTGTGGNFPAAYSYQPNGIQLDQFALYLERTP